MTLRIKVHSILFLFTLNCLVSPAAYAEAPPEPKLRAFRPVVPIKRIVPDSVAHESRVISLKIPPPPIPAPEATLFPENSVPEVNLSPESEVIGVASLEPGEFGLGEIAPEIDLLSGDEMPETLPIETESDSGSEDELTLQNLRREAHELAEMGLTYRFGADDPSEGGMDCSGVIQYLLKSLGVEDVPRTSYNQYYWLKRRKTLDDVAGRSASSKMLKKLSPGDLIFWGGTWDSGHRVSHVMLYMGYNPENDKHYIFGARGKKSKGLLGNGVDIFELDPDRGRLIAHGKIPGLEY